MQVKICGLTSLTDARWAVECGADLLGFIFVPTSQRFIHPARAAALAAELQEGGCRASLVGVFAGASAEEIAAVAEYCRLDLIQLHGPGATALAGGLPRPAILAHPVAGAIPWDEMERSPAWAHLLDTHDPRKLGGTGRAWSWTPADRAGLRVLVAGGLNPENVAQAVAATRPWGVDVAGGVEVSPGRKDRQKVLDFIHRARLATSKLERSG